jgi:O-methyltransferase domain
VVASAILEALLKANPSLKGTLFELPHIARSAVKRLRTAGLAHRRDVIEGDFFQIVPRS